MISLIKSYFAEFIPIPYRWSEKDDSVLMEHRAVLPQEINRIQQEFFAHLVSIIIFDLLFYMK